MVKKTLLINKTKKFKKGTFKKGQFFSDHNLLGRQISIDELQVKANLENQEELTQAVQEQDPAVQEVQSEAEKIGEVNQEVAKQGTKKKKITNTLLFVCNIVIVVVIMVYQLLNTEVQSFGDLINSGFFRPQYIPLVFLAFFGTMLIDTFKTSCLLHQSSKKWQFGLCYKMVALGRYWDSITPLSTGGEPYQIYYLSKHNVKAGVSISVTMARYIIFQLAWILTGVVATIYGTKAYGETNLVSVASYVGFALNSFMLIGTWVLSRSKKLGKILVAKGLKLLQKMHIVKNYEKQYDKVMGTVNGFQTTMGKFTKRKFTFVCLVASQILQFFVQNSVPYFICLMLGGTPDISIWFGMVMMVILIDLASSFIPLPGGTGMSEVSFTIIFTGMGWFPNGTVFWGLLMWRFMSYYMYIIQGLITTIYDYCWGDKKFEWQKKKWDLQAESNKFKQNQVKKYNKRTKGKIKI